MASRCITAGGFVACVLLAACHHASDPSSLCFTEPPDGTSQSALYRTLGPGTCDPPGSSLGGTSVTPSPIAAGSFAATLRFKVRGAKPDTRYYVQRAADFSRPLNADGICQRAEGLSPWTPTDGPVVPAFTTFPLPFADQGDKKTLSTDAAGDGSLEFHFESPVIPRGTTFDVEMRLVDDETAPTSELRSGCMTVSVQ